MQNTTKFPWQVCKEAKTKPILPGKQAQDRDRPLPNTTQYKQNAGRVAPARQPKHKHIATSVQHSHSMRVTKTEHSAYAVHHIRIFTAKREALPSVPSAICPILPWTGRT